jgi:hypothetical protein
MIGVPAMPIFSLRGRSWISRDLDVQGGTCVNRVAYFIIQFFARLQVHIFHDTPPKFHRLLRRGKIDFEVFSVVSVRPPALDVEIVLEVSQIRVDKSLKAHQLQQRNAGQNTHRIVV